ncbi:TonB-dependent receptor [Dyadobacter psychrotolerans]|uniref:TonB-dependent receptor n=1 Tax=Dyadobacter psychrotolerans TaxID=2541721 RepID=A0A4R5DXE3_9BACT|nr:TonB-dependent receptor [Dyadobacter psychrotolerans]TDE18597.1 TonB-dependent receptor [Dyadobacter psychrotolerans]
MQKLYIVLVLCALSFTCAFAQTGSLKGTVNTADGGPAVHVSISLKGTRIGAVSNSEGNYLIEKIQPGKYQVRVTLVGLQPVEKDIEITSGEITSSDFVLDESSQQLQEVVVTGGNSFKTDQTSPSLRLATPILEAPQNIQVIGRRVLADQQIFDMLEGVTRNVSGATRVEHWDNYALIYMRGSQIGAFRNGMNVQMTWGPLAEDVSMVDRIEFVKGPAGFMLANGDPSGFYNVVTKKPTGKTRGEVGFTLGSFDTYRTTLDLDGKLSKDGKLLYRLNLMGQLKGSHRDFEYNNRYSIVPVIKYQVDEKTAVTLEYTRQFSQMSIMGTNNAFSKKGYAELPRNFTTAEPNLAPTDINDNSILAILEHKINNDWRFTAQAAFFKYNQVGSTVWPQRFLPSNDSLMQRGVSIWDVLGLSKMGQMFINGTQKTGTVVHRILGGFDMSTKEYYHDFAQNYALGDSTFNIYKPVYGIATAPVLDRSRSIKERSVRYTNGYTALYVQDELGFWENKLRLTLAGRYTTLKTSTYYDGSYKTSKFTPRVGLSYSIDKSSALYLIYDQSFSENYGTDWQGKSFDPKTGNNMEVGLKRGWLNDKWSSTLSFYQITKNNVLTADLEHSTGGITFNRQNGQQKVKGIEWDIRGEILKGLDVMINYAYTNAKVTKDSDESVVGNQVAGSSKHVQNTWISYNLREGSLKGLGLSLGYQYQQGRAPWYVFDNSANSLPDYFRLDGGITFKSDKISYNLLVNNILNKYLYSGAPYTWGGYYYWQTEPGTNFRLSVSYKF